MEIVLGKTAGFCPGVKNSVKKAEEYVHENGETYCLGNLVHNEQVIEKLSKKGLKVIDNIEEAKNRVIFRAHGIEKQIYEKAKENQIHIIDLTCPKVLKIHEMAEKYADEGKFIFLIGEKKHPEVIGTKSFCGEKSAVIETVEELEQVLAQWKKSKCEKAVVLSQTTFHMEKFDEIVEKLKDKVKDIQVHKTICDATRIRQEETKKVANEVEVMIVIGGKKSSNTNKLVAIAKENCPKVQFVQTIEDLEEQELKDISKIGVMAGASTPDEIIQEVIEKLEQL